MSSRPPICHIRTKGNKAIPVQMKMYTSQDIIQKKMQYAINHLIPPENVEMIQSIEHLAGCSNHACKITLEDGRLVFIRIPGDNPQILPRDDLEQQENQIERTEGVFVNRALEYPSIETIEECGVNGVLPTYPLDDMPFNFDEKDRHAGFKIEAFNKECENLYDTFQEPEVRKAALTVLHNLHTQNVLDTWKEKVHNIFPDEDPPEYDLTERTQLMLHGIDAIQDTRTIGEKGSKNPHRIIGGHDIYAEGRTGVHVTSTKGTTTYTVLPTRDEVRDLVSEYDATKSAMGVNRDDPAQMRLCHNDMTPSNFMAPIEKQQDPKSITPEDVALIDFEFVAINDPMCDIAYLISENKKLLLSDEMITDMLKQYHEGEEVTPEQIEAEKNRIAYYLPLIDLKVAVWASYQSLLHNESGSLMGITKGWGKWNDFLNTLQDPFVVQQFEQCGALDKLNALREHAVSETVEATQDNTKPNYQFFDTAKERRQERSAAQEKLVEVDEKKNDSKGFN